MSWRLTVILLVVDSASSFSACSNSEWKRAAAYERTRWFAPCLMANKALVRHARDLKPPLTTRKSATGMRSTTPVLFLEFTDGDDSGFDEIEYEQRSNEKQPRDKPRPSTARIGGRSSSPTRKPHSDDGHPKWLTRFALPVLGILLLVKLLLGGLSGGGANSNYGYYQSSVYESRSLTPDGRVETSQKRSVRSNVPGLLERQKDDASSFLLKESPDEDFEQEIEALMRFQRSMFNDFF